MSEGNFEARKIGMRQNKEGVIISFVVQPDDYEAALAMVPIGTRVMIAWAEIGDDEKRIENGVKSITAPSSNGKTSDFESEDRGSTPRGAAKPKKRFEELSLVQQCAMRCEDSEFVTWFRQQTPPEWWEIANQDAASVMRNELGVSSRAELNTDIIAAKKWRNLERDFQVWRTTQQYAEVRR